MQANMDDIYHGFHH